MAGGLLGEARLREPQLSGGARPARSAKKKSLIDLCHTRFSPLYPTDCKECAQWDAQPSHRWKRAERCRPQCFWDRFGARAHRLLALFGVVGLKEEVDGGSLRYDLNWDAWREALRARHPLTDSEEYCEVCATGKDICAAHHTELLDAMLLIARELSQPSAEVLDAEARGEL